MGEPSGLHPGTSTQNFSRRVGYQKEPDVTSDPFKSRDRDAMKPSECRRMYPRRQSWVETFWPFKN